MNDVNFNTVISLNNKGNRKINIDGYDLSIERTTPSTIYWRCAARCGSRCVTTLNCETFIKTPNSHLNHNPKTTAQLESEKRLKEILNTASFAKPSQIATKFHGETSSAGCSYTDSQIKRKVSYEKRKKYEIQNIPISELKKFTKTIDGYDFILNDDQKNNHSIVIFGTDEDVQRLTTSAEWMCDGTFELTPNEYQQLFVILAKINNIWCPLIYVLMKKRTENDHYHAIDVILDKVNQMGLQPCLNWHSI